MRFWNYKSDEFYNLYSQIFDSNFSMEKKKVVLKALFSGEYCLMRITSISKQCYEEYKKNNFKKVTKFKRTNKRIIRHQFVSFNETPNLSMICCLTKSLFITRFCTKLSFVRVS